jgi:hypothetical protein
VTHVFEEIAQSVNFANAVSNATLKEQYETGIHVMEAVFEKQPVK